MSTWLKAHAGLGVAVSSAHQAAELMRPSGRPLILQVVPLCGAAVDQTKVAAAGGGSAFDQVELSLPPGWCTTDD